MSSLPMKSVTGQIVPLADVADLTFSKGPAQVSREGQSRRLTVEFNVRGRDLLSVVQEARSKVSAGMKPPTGYRVEWGGQFEHYREAGVSDLRDGSDAHGLGADHVQLPRQLHVHPGELERDRLMPERGTLNVDKATDLLGYSPRFPLELGVDKYVAWYRELVESPALR